jgi:hypothetical protein
LKKRKDAIRAYLSAIGKKGRKKLESIYGKDAMAVLGRRGGKARAAKYGAKALSAWAKKGGRPLKKGKRG